MKPVYLFYFGQGSSNKIVYPPHLAPDVSQGVIYPAINNFDVERVLLEW
jgi:hypothetical protein